MTADEKSPKTNADRGLRLRNILLHFFDTKDSDNAIAHAFRERTGHFCDVTTIKNWFKGRDIDCRALAHLAEMGADVYYILTGTRTVHPADGVKSAAQHKHFANLIGLLAEGEMRSGASPELYQSWLSFCARLNADLLELMNTMREPAEDQERQEQAESL